VISDGFTGSFGITFGLRKVMFGDWVRSIEIAVFPVDSWEFLGANVPAWHVHRRVGLPSPPVK